MADSVSDSDQMSPEIRARFSEFSAKIGLTAPVDFSNLAAPTTKNPLGVFKNLVSARMVLSVSDSVSDSRGKSKKNSPAYSRKVFFSRSGLPYRKARLVNGSTPHICFYCSSDQDKKLHRKRVLKDELAAITDRSERLAYVREAIKEINYLLYNDWHAAAPGPQLLPPPPQKIDYDFSSFTLLKAIDYVASIKRDVEGVKPTTIKEYNATKSTIVDFMQHASISQDIALRQISESFLRRYFDYLKQVRSHTNKTYNARRGMLHSVFASLIKRDRKLFNGENPIENFRPLRTESRGHAAYNDQQVQQIRDAILKAKQPHLLLFIQFIYYTLGRPKELRLIKVGDIDLENNRILFRAEIAKTSIGQWVGIPQHFKQIILASGIMNYPANYYVFSNSHGGSHLHLPGPTPVASSYFYKNIKPFVTALGLSKINSNYTLYSFKHTGAIALYKATKDIKLIQAQCRHQSIEQTNIYLKDLGVLSDFDQLNRWNGPI